LARTAATIPNKIATYQKQYTPLKNLSLKEEEPDIVTPTKHQASIHGMTFRSFVHSFIYNIVLESMIMTWNVHGLNDSLLRSVRVVSNIAQTVAQYEIAGL
jgi:hypothetical protein